MLVVHMGRHVAERVKASAPANVWSRMNAIDFMNSAMVFSALAVLCLFPILVRRRRDRRRRPTSPHQADGLGPKCRQGNRQPHVPGDHAATTLDFVGAVWILFGAIGVASTLQSWYQKVYDQPPGGKKVRRLTAQLVWVAGLVVYLAVQDVLNRNVTRWVGEF
jgi:membrane protein